MIKNVFKFLALPALVIILGIITVACGNPANTPARVNQDIVSNVSFSLDAAEVSLTTTTAGTIFVESTGKNKIDRKVVIVARVEIDPEDWAGVSFSIQKGWEVAAVISDYPQGSPNPESNTSTIYTASTDGEYQRIVEVGNTNHGAAEVNGGTGNIYIELIPMPDNGDIGDSMEIGIAVGSEKDYIAGPVHEVFQVALDKYSINE